ncbi:hypothetical protein BJV82DRAFT_320597 [Fennellomyces sp. T-0311]|nr:hypothetical protein BJV82DRAFT_320597 [Fennellomyces sp. T-0311]
MDCILITIAHRLLAIVQPFCLLCSQGNQIKTFFFFANMTRAPIRLVVSNVAIDPVFSKTLLRRSHNWLYIAILISFFYCYCFLRKRCQSLGYFRSNLGCRDEAQHMVRYASCCVRLRHLSIRLHVIHLSSYPRANHRWQVLVMWRVELQSPMTPDAWLGE